MQIIEKQYGRTALWVVMVIMAAEFLAACASPAVLMDPSPKDQTCESASFAMGTVITQTVSGPRAQAAIDEVIREMESLERVLTFKAPQGDIYQINQNAGIKKTGLNPATVKIIRKSLQVGQLSGGAFDITVGPLVRIWSTGVREKRIPSRDELEKALPLVNYRDIYVDDRSGGLKRTGQMIDLGGIAKGYAGDAAIKIYKKHGIASALINLGGNIVTLGSSPEGNTWKIGITNPRPRGDSTQGEQIIGYVNVKDKAVSTAGDNQRYFEKDGQRYHHILDPRTGYPAKTDLMSVTLVTESSFDSDAFDTAVFILGLEKGRELLRQCGNIEAVFVTADKNIYVTEGLKGNFVFHDESGEYRYDQ